MTAIIFNLFRGNGSLLVPIGRVNIEEKMFEGMCGGRPLPWRRERRVGGKPGEVRGQPRVALEAARQAG